MQLAYGILFNKQLAENYDIEDLYTVVDEGRWTIDYLAEKAAAVYVDTNGNGTRDMDDTYGFVGDEVTGLDVWPAAFDIPLIAANDSGELEVVTNSEKMVSGLEKILNLYYNIIIMKARTRCTTGKSTICSKLKNRSLLPQD